MENDQNEIVDLYVPRKCSSSSRIIAAKDHGAIQIDFVDVDPSTGRLIPGKVTRYAICGALRSMSKSLQSSLFIDLWDLGLAIRQCKKQKAVFGVSVQESTQKFAVVARVDKQLATSGFKALDWVNKVCEIAQGRGGGKDEQAQATCEKLEKLSEAIEAARQFAKLSISS
ncbi:40S ribosomal protein S21 [Aphelenchoides besseyi]|nr:40S ribosomal protein S21 [Aphelenchoides besseyi]